MRSPLPVPALPDGLVGVPPPAVEGNPPTPPLNLWCLCCPSAPRRPPSRLAQSSSSFLKGPEWGIPDRVWGEGSGRWALGLKLIGTSASKLQWHNLTRLHTHLQTQIPSPQSKHLLTSKPVAAVGSKGQEAKWIVRLRNGIASAWAEEFRWKTWHTIVLHSKKDNRKTIGRKYTKTWAVVCLLSS